LKILSKNFQNSEIFFSFENEDIYIYATPIAKHFGKPLANWLRNKETKEYVETFSKIKKIDAEQLIIVKQGGNAKEQGTWIHKRLIINFARWLSPEFAIWCDETIEEILRTGSFSLKDNTLDLQKIRERAELIHLASNLAIDYKKWFFEVGITRPEELGITVNKSVAKDTTVDFLEIAEKKGLSTTEKYYTVTELCEIVMNGDFSEEAKKLVSTKKGDKPRPQNLNKFLQELGFQEKDEDIWKATEKGQNFSDFVQNKSRHSEKTVFHTVWKKEILNEVF
jgi:hypothetical protein